MVELLVVIGIIGILIALLLPSLNRARSIAQRTACLSTLRQLGLASQMYLSDNHDWYLPIKWGFEISAPPGWPGPPSGLTPPTVPHTQWIANPLFRQNMHLSTATDRVPYGLICPKAVLAISDETSAGFPWTRSYGYNLTGISYYANPPTYFAGYKRREVYLPSTKLMIVDATNRMATEGQSTLYPIHGEAYDPTCSTMTAYRHEGGANVLFFDAHVEWMPMRTVANNDKLWQPRLH